MHFTTLASIALLSALEFASAEDHSVAVGESGFTFNPSTITASKGDTVSFKINEGHNVNGGDFSKPCQWAGFSSGSSAGGKTFTITINDTQPIYGFCGFPGHCKSGMVFAINPPSSGNTFDAYEAAAKKSSTSNDSPSMVGGTFDKASTSSTTTSSSGGSSSTPAPSNSGTSSTSTSTSTGAAAPGAHGQDGFFTAAVMMIAGGLSWFV